MSPSDRSSTYVALLRGVNVGGHSAISMKALAASLEELAFTDIRTYINSGNVLFRSKERDQRKLETAIEKLLARRHQLQTRVIVRSFKEIERLIKHWPKDWNGDKGWKYNVIFLSHAIDSKELLASFKPREEIERVVYVPGTLLWSAQISSLGRTSMMKLGRSATYQEVTVRNHTTAKKLYDLMKQMDGRLR
jgi:uncharacterized protein (DUF1697 family)